MTTCLLMLTIAAAPLDGFVVILGGGKAIAEAESAQREWVDGQKWKPVVAADGWPKAMASDSIVGLKPGLQIAVLGVCPLEKAAVAQAAATSNQGAYLRRVKWSEPFTCPALRPEFTVKPVGTLTSAGGSLRVTKVESKSERFPVLELLDKDGAVLEVRGADLGEAEKRAKAAPDTRAPGLPPFRTTAGDVKLAGDQVELVIDVSGCSTVEMTQRVKLDGAKLVVSWLRGAEARPGHCDN